MPCNSIRYLQRKEGCINDWYSNELSLNNKFLYKNYCFHRNIYVPPYPNRYIVVPTVGPINHQTAYDLSVGIYSAICPNFLYERHRQRTLFTEKAAAKDITKTMLMLIIMERYKIISFWVVLAEQLNMCSVSCCPWQLFDVMPPTRVQYAWRLHQTNLSLFVLAIPLLAIFTLY